MMPTADERGAGTAESWATVEELCDRYLGGRPSEQALRVLKTVEEQRPEVREFTERGFRLMAISKFDARDISPVVAQFFAVMAPAILPGAWGGMVPPITVAGRHKKIDEYLRKNAWAKFEDGTVLLDVGCGFPPQTGIDAAQAFPDWQIVGVDPAFEDYLVYDDKGNYASIGRTDERSGRVRYFQPVPQHFLALFADRNATIRKFEEAFVRLRPELPADDGTLAAVEREGMRLVRHPMKQYERPNLKFMQAGFGSEGLPRADVVRAFNVLLYYDADFRRAAEEWAATALRPGGLFICGRDDAASLNAHYSVYRNQDGRLVEKEFAFGVELVRQPAWYTVHDGDRETWRLAELIGVLRSDQEFLRDYDARLDALLAEHKFNVRDENGCLADHPDAGDPVQRFPSYLSITDAMQNEFTDRAVVALTQAGINAWRNPVGHVAVSPKRSG
jgi:SAM-dependent methyltransferase